MARATTAAADGDYPAAVDHARRAVAIARPLGGFFLARALVTLGELVSLTDDFPASEAAYREAVTIAEAGHHDELRATALASLMAAIARQPGREREALALRPLAVAAVDAAGLSTAYSSVIEQSTGVAELALGDLDAAVESLTASLTAARAVIPADDPRMPEYLYPLALALGMVGRDEESAALHDEAVAVASKIWGADHPQTARFVINAATAHARLGHCDRAITELAAARTALTGVLPADSPEHLTITETIGSCYHLLGKDDDAEREHLARQAALTAAGRDHSVEFAAAWVDLGDVALARGDAATAIADYGKAIALDEAVVGTTDARLGLPLTRLGEAHLAARHPARAIAPLERAVTVLADAGAPPTMRADAGFPLARALVLTGGDRDRARELARAALAAYRAGSTFYAERANAAEAWLTALR